MKTPLLVPSFSSKGFRFKLKGKLKGKSEIRDAFKNTAEILTESMLVSAYDIFYGHLPGPNRFPCTPTVTFVDSGGYETGADYDYSAILRHDHKIATWNLKRYENVLDSWPDRVPAVFVSYDKGSAGKPLSQQIDDARKLFSRYPKHLHNFLIKPTRRCKGLLSNTIRTFQPAIRELRGFHIIGITEKELGHSMLDRMETVATLRRNLNAAKIASPIQIFGALDPFSSCLYFLAGAEIFDGLTWLRFAYSEGRCVYTRNYGVLRVGVDGHDDFIDSKILSDNYSELRKLQLSLKDFVSTHTFEKLSPHSDFLAGAYDSLIARIGAA